MADRKISQLPHLEQIDGNEEFVVEKEGYNYNVTIDDIRDGLASSEEVEEIKDAQEQDLAKITELQGKLNGVGNIQDALDAKADATDVQAIESKIPSQASENNKLADKDFVNSSIATNTADFKGTFTSLDQLQSTTADANDYGFVVTTDAEGNTVYNRYKYVTGIGWVFEYALNNSSFTAAQWAVIQSGITSGDVEKLKSLPNAGDILTGKQAATKYQPKGDYVERNEFDAVEQLAESINQGLGELEQNLSGIENKLSKIPGFVAQNSNIIKPNTKVIFNDHSTPTPILDINIDDWNVGDRSLVFTNATFLSENIYYLDMGIDSTTAGGIGIIWDMECIGTLEGLYDGKNIVLAKMGYLFSKLKP